MPGDAKHQSSGESGGGAYPNPHTGKTPQSRPGDFLGQGDQTGTDDHDPGHRGDEKADKGRVVQGD